MIGQKHIPQTITGDQAEKIAKTLPGKDCTQQTKSRTPLPGRVTINWD